MMKRQQDRESPPRTKRSRSVYQDEVMRDRLSPDFDRRDGRNDRSFDGGYSPPSAMPPVRSDPKPAPEYRSLCVSCIPSKIPDPVLKEALIREFTKFGEMNVKVTISGDQRVAYVNFRYPEDARNARHAKGKLIIFERQVRVEPVIKYYRRRSTSPEFQRDFYKPGGRGSPPPHFRQGPPRGPPMREYQPREQVVPKHLSPGEVPRRAPNEKFPHHLDHVDPEFDTKATRTLFVGNLDVNISDPDLKHIFEKFGVVEDIDIKRPQRGQGNAYAFIKFMILDAAHKAKVEMSGKYIGRFQCKIGYGKVTPTTCLWVGGLGTHINYDTLEREFDRFGVINKIEWPSGKSYAYVLYDSIDAASAACQEMRGAQLAGQTKRLRVDFADVTHIGLPPVPQPETFPPHDGGFRPEKVPWKGPDDRRPDWSAGPDANHPRPIEHGRKPEWDRYSEDRNRRPRSPDFGNGTGRRTPERREFHVEREDGRRSGEFDRPIGRDHMSDSGITKDMGRNYDTLDDVIHNLPVAWNGALILKSSAFAARMHVLGGDVTVVDNLMRDPTTTESPVLKITQRLRLDQPKLDDVSRRIAQSGPHGHCILLALPSTLQNYDDSNGSIQQRPLRNLMQYLKQKVAAGVISLPPNPSQDKNNVGVLHAFPPCQFGYNFLLKRSPNLPPDYEMFKDDYLVVVVVLGAS
ncbi:hypothetical protein LOTGIDRAFT_224309 [Lottia gigantea]|uniref:RNA-binding protein 15 n=1 Tax=Lottia gigantea TaxID=225164 RepID=V4CME3_LOTGI|nr:hypothetical protein LOTGIDRAFT_224309 [Lottia gigantea]ESP03510.1 hypothetical protein LOTGIDRAFT_224309 [Lottia gigantea]